ncbi:hypothetical protein MHYP_G00329650 [Metynnis hypsauchen]
MVKIETCLRNVWAGEHVVQTAFSVRLKITLRKPDFEFLNADPLLGILKEAPFIWAHWLRKRHRCHKRGRRAGVLVRLRRRANRPHSPRYYWQRTRGTNLFPPLVTAMYIPPQADTDLALGKLFEAVNRQETAHPEAAFIVVGDFNKAKFRENTLDHCNSNFREAYKFPPTSVWQIGSSLHSAPAHL